MCLCVFYYCIDGCGQEEVVASGALLCWYNWAVEQQREESGRRGQSTTHRRERERDWNAQRTGIYACSDLLKCTSDGCKYFILQ